MDPISAMATASAAFNTIKKGFQVGRDIEQMASDLGRWMGALSDIEQAEKEAKNPPIFKKLFSGKSIEQEAMEAFAAKKKTQQQRDELKQWLQFTVGSKAWDELVRMEGQIRKQRQETLYKQRERRQKFMEIVAWIFVTSLAAGLFYAFVMFLLSKQANANTKWVTCRLHSYEKIKQKDSVYPHYLCVYKGANNTIETMTIEEFCPREYQCEYNPRAKDGPTLKETLDSIRKELQ
jgi:hypothetical protein